ncbi:MAG: sulfurtransferase TusA family protein [Prochlorococcaceae cyanobacterium]|jgi:TusA-related sulfurtransferase
MSPTSSPDPREAPPEGAVPAATLDLCGTPCPLNFIRTRLTLETIPPGAWLQVDLDEGEPAEMVGEGIEAAGHRLHRGEAVEGVVRLWIRRHGE